MVVSCLGFTSKVWGRAKGNHRELSRTYFQNLGPLPQTLEVNPRHETTILDFSFFFSSVRVNDELVYYISSILFFLLSQVYKTTMLNRIAKGNHRELSRTYFQNLGPLPQTLEVNPRQFFVVSAGCAGRRDRELRICGSAGRCPLGAGHPGTSLGTDLGTVERNTVIPAGVPA
jgi:hypothetical protein